MNNNGSPLIAGQKAKPKITSEAKILFMTVIAQQQQRTCHDNQMNGGAKKIKIHFVSHLIRINNPLEGWCECSLWYNIVSTSTSTSVSFHFPIFFRSLLFLFHIMAYTYIWIACSPNNALQRISNSSGTQSSYTPSEEEEEKNYNNNNSYAYYRLASHTQNHFHHGSNQHIFRSLKVKKRHTHHVTVCELCRMHEISWTNGNPQTYKGVWLCGWIVSACRNTNA